MLGKFVRDYLTKNRSPNRGSNMFRIGAAGKCYLYRCFLREGVKESNPYTQDILGIFTIGNFIHEWLQAALDEKGILLDQELKITYPEWEATGRFDALIKKDDLVYLYDFKTVILGEAVSKTNVAELIFDSMPAEFMHWMLTCFVPSPGESFHSTRILPPPSLGLSRT